METTRFRIVLNVLLITILFTLSCQKEEITDEKSVNQNIVMLKSGNTLSVDCETGCIDPSGNTYLEKSDSKTVTWGNPKKSSSKTVSITYYNTLTSFVLKVSSTSGWSDLLINGISSWTNRPVAPNTYGIYSVPLPEGWKVCSDYNFLLQVTGNGTPVTFNVEYKLIGPCPVTDVEGNTYKTVVIGNQVWMAHNLKVTQYNNGDPIPTTIPASLDYSGETAPKYQWAYNGDNNNLNDYGRLYTWFAVTDSRGVCPVGWHLPSDSDWGKMITLLGGSSVSDGKLKETGTSHWIHPNQDATNISGFTALPGGYRYGGGYSGVPAFDNLGYFGYF
jgi:uncharacterized protein (TIGR02145 family)